MKLAARHAPVAAPAALLLWAATIAGCASPLPTYPAMDDADSLRIITARLDSVQSISASADLTLTNAQGQSVSLDAALAARPPSRARLRAWKFGSPVLDLTILPEGVWAFAISRDDPASSDISTLPAAGVSQSLGLLSGAYFSGAHAIAGESTVATLVVTGSALGRDDVRCEIDRSTLTPRRFTVPASPQEMTLELDRYALVGDVPWPHRLTFVGAGGAIVIRLGDVDLNGEMSDTAFVPPKRAMQLP